MAEGILRQAAGDLLEVHSAGSEPAGYVHPKAIAALNEINTADICIRTAEDPIEYTLPGLLQMQMQRKIGLTFATALRAFLRQDPEVIFVG